MNRLIFFTTLVALTCSVRSVRPVFAQSLSAKGTETLSPVSKRAELPVFTGHYSSLQDTRLDTVIEKASVSAGLNAVYLAAFQGIGLNGFYNFPANWSVGVGTTYGGLNDIPRFAAGGFFTNPESINLRWLYAVALHGRYTFGKNIEGFYVELNAGYEGWRVRPDGVTDTENIITNAFVVPVVGFNWFPVARSGFFVNANLSSIFLFGGPAEDLQTGAVRYRFRNNSFTSPSPGIQLGWRF
ncbi:MAG: hypothetical protein IAF08_03125 [Rhizobacter sp.]|nr:hypothetical protein [Chlorobiales bacterium]